MTTKEQAEKLLNTYCKLMGRHDSRVSTRPNATVAIKHAKECALICVDEILKVGFLDTNDLYEHWNAVKEEIEKL